MEISKYSFCCSRGGCGRCPGCGSAWRPRRGRGSSRGAPGTLGGDALCRSAFPPPGCEPRSHLLRLGCRCGCGTARPGLAELPRISLPRPLPAGSDAEFPALPQCGSISARVSPFPRDVPVPCPAPSPPAGVMLRGPRASSGDLRYPRVNHPLLGTGGSPRSGHPSGVCIREPVPPISSPSGLFVPKGELGFFISIFQPSQSSSEGSA